MSWIGVCLRAVVHSLRRSSILTLRSCRARHAWGLCQLLPLLRLPSPRQVDVRVAARGLRDALSAVGLRRPADRGVVTTLAIHDTVRHISIPLPCDASVETCVASAPMDPDGVAVLGLLLLLGLRHVALQHESGQG